MSVASTQRSLPEPLCDEPFTRLRRGIYDADEIEVYLNDKRDFAFLHPRPEVDYRAYRPRVEALGLRSYKRARPVIERRFEKIRDVFRGIRSVLEIGAADGEFLAHVASIHPDLELASLEVDQNTRSARDALAGLAQFPSFDAIRQAGARFDRVCMFHVLEHIRDPAPFLARCTEALTPEGRLVIEVPSLSDPLLSVYHSAPYEQFYFQRQHPYVYSAGSLVRLLEACGLRPEAPIAHQRYGLENHLQWLAAGQPGGSAELRALFADADASYLRCLEESGHTDAVIVVVGVLP
ncbi:MAG: class I SAM-dependent methyltransferase [Myxococcota bacterium]